MKPENFAFENGESGTIKIIDLGFAKSTEEDALTTSCGAPGYVGKWIPNSNEIEF